MNSENKKIKSLATLGIELNQVHDLDILLELVLSKAREFSNADAGSIYIREGEMLRFSYTQNNTLQSRIPEGEKLIYSTFSLPIDRSSIAGYVAYTGRPLNIPDVYHLNAAIPCTFNKKFDIATGYRTASLLTMPMKTSKRGIVGVLQIINPIDDKGNIGPFSSFDEEIMRNFASIAAVAVERAQMTRATILRMIRMAEMRDPKETGAHVNRVGAYSVELYERWAKRKNIPIDIIDMNRDCLRLGAMLHDVGKVAISDNILKKPGRFNNTEFEIMKTHTIYGAHLFKDRQSEYDDVAAEVALNHHERWDGKGYPGDGVNMEHILKPPARVPEGLGKREGEIPIFGRIVALADVFDALSSVRVYKDAWKEEDVLAEIHKERGKHFDPELVDIFMGCLEVIRSIQSRYQNQQDDE